MDRTDKERIVASLKESLARAEVVVLTQYSGLTVSALNELRRSMRSAGASFRVTKNRLAQRALEGTPYGGLKTLLKGPTAIAVSHDVSAAPKAAVEFSKKNERLVIVGGAVGANLLDAQGVRALAALP
ncbi:MAG: 50S ribosomal protein L10, partial [Alphaproteobacteria bacterium]|nr:50S ribosomal protein L10 [Alphaproteobacteria bacterium]